MEEEDDMFEFLCHVCLQYFLAHDRHPRGPNCAGAALQLRGAGR